jgi:pimeloyl-ACP methyl ester carboxylesterase
VDETRIEYATSADGTRIGFERVGAGPPLLVVHGGTADRTRWAAVVPGLAERFALLLVDRRGRGLSADGDAPHSLDREVEDLVAVAAVPGGPVRVLAHSFGGLVALEAALITPAINRLVVYEPPFGTPGLPAVEADVLSRITELSASGDRDGALEVFLSRVAGVPDDRLRAMRGTSIWSARIAALPTITREAAALADYRFAAQRFAGLSTPVRFLIGTASPAPLRASTSAAHAAVPGSELVELAGQGHAAMDTAPELFLDAVLDFLG